MAFHQKSCVSAGARRAVNRNKFASPNLSIHTHTHNHWSDWASKRSDSILSSVRCHPLGSLVGILFPWLHCWPIVPKEVIGLCVVKSTILLKEPLFLGLAYILQFWWMVRPEWIVLILFLKDEMFSSRSSKDCQERNAELCLENSVVQPLLTDLYQITMVIQFLLIKFV